MNFNSDYYAILGIMPTAEDFVIRAVYKALAQRYHPDRFKGSFEESNRKMAEINEAYSILSDPIRRHEYDAHRAQVGEGGSYFDDKPNDTSPEYDPLEQDWKLAVSYYPDLIDMESGLAQIAWRLAYAYRVCLLETRNFTQRDEIAVALEQNFIESYFGKNRRIVDFARRLIYSGQKKAARELNKSVSFFGDKIDAELVIAKINTDFNDPLGELKAWKEYQQQLKEQQEKEHKRQHQQQLREYLSILKNFGCEVISLPEIDSWKIITKSKEVFEINSLSDFNPVIEHCDRKIQKDDKIIEFNIMAPIVFILLICLAVLFRLDPQIENATQLSESQNSNQEAARNEWLGEIHQLQKSIDNGEVKLINGISQFFSSKEAAEKFSYSNYPEKAHTKMEVMNLENGNRWWLEKDKLFIRVKNSSQKPVSLILLEFYNGECATLESVLKEYYLVTFEKPVSPNITTVITTKLKLINKKSYGMCANIINAW